jgi:hypothetical protein
MKRFWISWYCDSDFADAEHDYKVWISGYDAQNRSVFVADMMAESEASAWKKVGKLYPEHEQRFCNEVELDWQPSDRFR